MCRMRCACREGVRLEHLLLVKPGRVEDNLWAAEQSLRASCCGAVLLWQDHVEERALRRLQLAAESASTSLFLFRSTRVTPASLAALRLHVSRAQGRTVVRILKRRGAGCPRPLRSICTAHLLRVCDELSPRACASRPSQHYTENPCYLRGMSDAVARLAVRFTASRGLRTRGAHGGSARCRQLEWRQTEIIACNDVARRRGVKAGMSPAAASALAVDLQLVSRNPPAESAALERIAAWQFSSRPHKHRRSGRSPARIAGSLAIFGGLKRLWTKYPKACARSAMPHRSRARRHRSQRSGLPCRSQRASEPHRCIEDEPS